MKMQKGFTLIELMIVVAIVGILASVALPAYSRYVQRGKIAEATSSLSAARVSMEQYYQDNRTYQNAAGTACGAVMPAFKYFTLTCAAGTATTYTITATAPGAPPPVGTSDNSMAGFTYTIDQSNAKQTTAAPTGWAAAAMPTACWITKPGGAC